LKFDWKAAAGILISVVLIWWVLRGVDLTEVMVYVRQAHLGYLLISVFIGTAGYFVRALRWKVFLDPIQRDTGLHNRFKAVSIGFAINNVFPLRLGEIARPVVFSRMEGMAVSSAVGTLVIERVFDTIALTTLLIVPVLLPSFPRELIAENQSLLILFKAAFTGVVVVLVVLLALLLFPAPTVRLAEAVGGRLPDPWGGRIVQALEMFLEALNALRSPRVILLGLLWSYVFWIWHGLSFWFAFLAFGVEAPIEAAFFVEAVIGFVVAIPAAPGFFGTFQVGALLALVTTYGIAEAPVVAFAFGYHITTFIPITVIGLIYASRVGLSVAELGDGGVQDQGAS
jgi:glycosyltransferase 2 family protein